MPPIPAPPAKVPPTEVPQRKVDPTEVAPLISVRHLKKRFNVDAGFFAAQRDFVYAVNDVSFDLHRGETYGLVGESGSGKTTTARMLLGMYAACGGEILYAPTPAETLDVLTMKKGQLKAYREKIKYIFQDPARSLNPRLCVQDILLSGFRYSAAGRLCSKGEALEKAGRALEEVGLSADDLNRRPSNFSGGQRQRISIARALLLEPEILVCDEVVSALDISIQSQILNLLLDLRETRGLSIVFITHNLKVAGYFCDRLGIMLQGRIIREIPAEDAAGVQDFLKINQ